MVFGSIAKGYKAGGFNSVEVDSQFDNEDVWNFEAGVKSLYSHVGVMLNASMFYYLYSDKQAISLVSGIDGSGVPQYVVETSDEEAWGIDARRAGSRTTTSRCTRTWRSSTPRTRTR